MKKIFIILILMATVFLPHSDIFNVYAEDKFVKVVYTSTYIFKEAEAIEENIIAEFKYGTEFLVVESNVQGKDFSYYKIKINNIENYTEAYVLTSQVIDTSIFTPKQELDTNATISGNAEVYAEANDETKIDVLKDGTKIRLISGYDESVKFSKIQYINRDGEIITAYIKTSNIKVSHISRVLIGVIIITVTSISIILILFGVKKSRKGGIKKIFKKNKN